MTFKSKSLCFSFKKNINLNENRKSHTHLQRDEPCASVHKESPIGSKTLFYSQEIFLTLFFNSIDSVLNKLSEYIYFDILLINAYQKTLLYTLFCLLLKSSKALSVSLSQSKLSDVKQYILMIPMIAITTTVRNFNQSLRVAFKNLIKKYAIRILNILPDFLFSKNFTTKFQCHF